KSTFVKHATYYLAQAGLETDSARALEKLTPWTHGALLPIWVELRQVAAFTGGQRKSRAGNLLLAYFQHFLEEYALEEFWKDLKTLIRAKKTTLLFLLDGLDEVPSQQRERIVAAVNNFAARYDQHRYIVTCRPYAYVGQPWKLENFHEVTLAPFNEEQIMHFVENWYQRLVERGRLQADLATSRAERLKQAVKRRDLRELAERPLLLTVMAQLNTFRGKLPDDRTELYADAVKLLMERWEQRLDNEKGLLEMLAIPGLKMSDLEAGLYEVAYRAHEQGAADASTADIREADLKTWLQPYLGGHAEKAAQFIRYIRERAGLLIRHKSAAYTFPHRTFQEFLAACYLANDGDFPGKAAGLARDNPDRWQVVFVLAAGHAARTHRLSPAVAAVNALLPSPVADTEAAPIDWFAARLAAETLLEIGEVGVNRDAAGPSVRKRTQAWLAVALGSADRLAPAERTASGVALGKLGDLRAAVMDVDAMPFCFVPAGEFVMGEKKEEHRVALQAFWMAQSPVTNAQFQAFVDAGGYGERSLWLEAEKAGRWEKSAVIREVYTGSEWTQEHGQQPYDYGEPYNLPNHP
ncbi:MAG: SUMF1/EgtB/PvdO family nonheme iron enzyme, partial [Chloroflexi bacterium]|nr:SUMF1/EgtB/PvdO family nonheme iron enzyme [Chloroflexota bacterium]